MDSVLGHERGQALSIGERFGIEVRTHNAPTDPQGFTQYITESYGPLVAPLFRSYVAAGWLDAYTDAKSKTDKPSQRKVVQGIFNQRVRALDRNFSEARKDLLEQNRNDEREGDTFGDDALKPFIDEAKSEVQTLLNDWVKAVVGILPEPKSETKESNTEGHDSQEPTLEEGKKEPERPNTIPAVDARTEDKWREEVTTLVRSFAMLDGYDVLLRDPSLPTKQEKPLEESKSWAAPVRVWMRNDDWSNEDETVKGSHDSKGNVRPGYVAAHTQEDGSVDPALLEPDCIESNDYNLSAGRYKPFKLQARTHEPPATIIRRLLKMEDNIQDGLSRLLEIVEG